MGILNHLFGSTESAAKEMKADEETIIKHWKHYLETINRKTDIITHIWHHDEFDFNKYVEELKKLLNLELVDISDEEKEEAELISDLESIEHEKKVKRVEKLEQCLGYAETKYEYVYRLLQQLHSILKSQIHILTKMQKGSKDPEKLVVHLKSQLELELTILGKIDQIGTFHNLFLALIKGEHIVKTMDAKEKKLLKKMQKGMGKIFSDDKKQGVTHEWTMTVFNAIEDKFRELEAQGIIDNHPDVDFELVNRPEFIDLVKEIIQKIKKRNISEQMINVFVHLFREWYNHERD